MQEKSQKKSLADLGTDVSPVYIYERGLHETIHTAPDETDLFKGLSMDFESIFYVDLDKNTIYTYRSNTRLDYLFGQNNQMCDFSGFREDYAMSWVYPEDRAMFSEALSTEYIRSKLADYKMFYVNFRVAAGGKLEYFQLRVVNISEGDRISRIVLGTRSIDNEVRYEQKQKEILAKALVQAKSAVAAKNVFLSNISHDIRTPMNAIIGFTALARKHADNPTKLLNDLDMITDSSEQLLRLLNDVLEIAWSESGKLQTKEDPCDLAEIIQGVQNTLECRATAKKIRFDLDLSRLQYTKVLSDSDKLNQLFMHLCDNAIKYTPIDGQIRVSAELTETSHTGYGSYCFIIEDNGIGISRKFLPHIFEPFERQENTTISGVHGMGLGLTIVKNIVEMLQGEIEVQSEPGVGTRFTITLNIPIDELPSSQNIEDIPVSPIGDQKILIVEDNEINLQIETELLTDLGFALDTAPDGCVAVDMVKHSEPGNYALILMDIQMPVMNGYEATAAIRKLEHPTLANIPIIALSANTFPEDIQKSRESGMNAHLAKPIDIPKLLELIRQIMSEDIPSTETRFFLS
ncbi:MAG: response regulator [Lachnospiraceae bacterium]|nr:response regulator [Lachnospiraceae bacterium]